MNQTNVYRYGMSMIGTVLACTIAGCSPAPKKAFTPKSAPVAIHHPIPVKKNIRKVCATKPTVVAVLDTGLTLPPVYSNVNLCKFGHRNFTQVVDVNQLKGFHDPIPVDNHGHGTNVVGLIGKYAGNTNYCIVVIKYYDPRDINAHNLSNTVKAINYATNIGAKYINYSGGGIEMSNDESAAVKRFIDKGGTFIAAAGNEGSDLSTLGYYPAMDDKRVIVVGSVNKYGTVESYSNYGERVNRYEEGTDQVGLGITMSGTSQAAAIATGKIINEQECDK